MLYRRRSPLSMVVSVVIFLACASVAAIKIRGALKKSDKVDQQAKRLDQLSEGKLGSSMVIARNLARAVNQVAARIGPQGLVLQVSVNPTSADFEYVIGERAAGYLETSESPVLQPEQETLEDPGSPRPHAFPLALVRPRAPSELVAAIRHRPGLSDFSLSDALLSRDPLSNKPAWVVSGSGGGHDLTFRARPNGSGLRQLPS
jgi:hypothetical protein